jgi:hypothetical protein
VAVGHVVFAGRCGSLGGGRPQAVEAVEAQETDQRQEIDRDPLEAQRARVRRGFHQQFAGAMQLRHHPHEHVGNRHAGGERDDVAAILDDAAERMQAFARQEHRDEDQDRGQGFHHRSVPDARLRAASW